MRVRNVLMVLLMHALITSVVCAQNERDTAVRKDKRELAEDESWIYDDLDKALEVAAEAKRPLMIVFR